MTQSEVVTTTENEYEFVALFKALPKEKQGVLMQHLRAGAEQGE